MGMLQSLGCQIGCSSCGALPPDQWVLAHYICTQACPSCTPLHVDAVVQARNLSLPAGDM